MKGQTARAQQTMPSPSPILLPSHEAASRAFCWRIEAVMPVADFTDTPSIIHSGYSSLTAREKRDLLFDQGIRPTAYGIPGNGDKPDVIGGVVEFGEAALRSVKNHSLRETLTRVSDELGRHVAVAGLTLKTMFPVPEFASAVLVY